MSLLAWQPFDLNLALTMGQALRWREGEDGWYVGVVRGRIIKLRQTHTQVEFRSSGPETSMDSVLNDYLTLDENIAPVHKALIDHSPQMARLVELYGGLRVLHQEPWECLITYICSPRNMVKNNIRAVEQLAINYGKPLSLDGIKRHAFPTPECLATASVDALRSLWLGLPRHAEYVHRLAEAVVTGSLDLDSVMRMPYTEAKHRLMQLNGIGEKVADCVLLFSLNKPEAFPIDTNIRRALREFCDLRGSDSELLGYVREGFGSHAGYASQLLFHGIRNRAI